MTGKEALETIGMTKTNNIKSESLSKPRVMYLVKELRKKEIQTIKKDLDRLKELEKENDKLKEVIKNLKSMDIKLEYHPKNIKHQYILRIKAFGKDLFFDLVNEIRYNLLKEVLGNEKNN